MRSIKNIFLILIVAVAFINCKKDNNVLGVESQPSSDAFNTSFSDTSIVYAHTIKHNRILSFNDRYKYLGSVHDPYLGRTDAGIYTNINLPNGTTNILFGEDANLVYAEIILKIADIGFAGNTTVPITYSVFPVTTAIDKAKAYYTCNDSLHNKNAVLGTYTGTYTFLNGSPVLKIQIDQNYAKAILTSPQYLTDNSIFQANYKGFYISSESSNLNPVNAQGSILRFDLEDEISGFYLYYQNGTPSATKENKSFKFVFSGSDAAKYNTVKYQPQNDLLPTSNYYQQIIAGDSTGGKQNLYLKGLGGTKIKIHIPGLKNYADSFPVSVNRAELVVNFDPTFLSPNGQYLPPPKLTLLAIGSDNETELYVADQLTAADLQRYDGNYDYTNNKCTFNIARQVQAILRGAKPNYGFYLLVADPSPVYTARRDNYMERLILAGSNNPTLKPKFSISYIKFKNDKK